MAIADHEPTGTSTTSNGVNGVSQESPVFYPSDEFKENAHITSMDQYKRMYKRSVEDPEGFWSEIASEFFFKSGPAGPFMTYNFDVTRGTIQTKWMEGAVTNMCYNVVDRIIERGMGDRVAYIWYVVQPSVSEHIRFRLHAKLIVCVCQIESVCAQVRAVVFRVVS